MQIFDQPQYHILERSRVDYDFVNLYEVCTRLAPSLGSIVCQWTHLCLFPHPRV
jgi:hypothetical protein